MDNTKNQPHYTAPAALQVKADTPDLDYTDDDMVGEWVGLHYGRNFDAMSKEDQDSYRERFLEMHEVSKAG